MQGKHSQGFTFPSQSLSSLSVEGAWNLALATWEEDWFLQQDYIKECFHLKLLMLQSSLLT